MTWAKILEACCGKSCTPEDAGFAADEIGPELARWIFRPEALEAARKSGIFSETVSAGLVHPRIPPISGACGVIIVLDAAGGTTGLGLLGPSFVFPVQWKQGVRDSVRLPHSLLETARSVRKQLEQAKLPPPLESGRPISWSSWGLQPLEIPDGLDVSDWPLSSDSGWFSLAGTLAVAAYGGRTNPEVGASIAWSALDGLAPVKCVEEKVRAACHAGMKVFFVFGRDIETARSTGDGLGIECRRISETGAAGLWKALSPFLQELDVPPRGSPAEVLDYYRRQKVLHGRRSVHQEYFVEEVLHELANRIRGKGIQGLDGWPDRLLIVQSGDNWELALILHAVFRPAAFKCLSCMTEDSGEKADNFLKAREILERYLPEGSVDNLGDESEVCDAARDFLVSPAPGGIGAVEITGGSKPMTVYLAWAAIYAGAHVLYLDAIKDRNNPDPANARLRLVRPNPDEPSS